MTVIVDPSNPTGWLEVGSPGTGFALTGPCWTIPDDLTVLIAPSVYRGGDSVVVAHQRGRVPMPMIVDEATFKFRFPIAGDVDPDGLRYDDPMVGYLSNLAQLRTVTDPPSLLDSPDSTRTVTYHLPPGYLAETLTATCQLELDVTGAMAIGSDIAGYYGTLKRAVLTVRCPAGLFEMA